jgi:hypothetical protein
MNSERKIHHNLIPSQKLRQLPCSNYSRFKKDFWRKIIFMAALLASLLSGRSVLGEENASATNELLTTTDGRVYRKVILSKVEPDGIRISHEDGAAKILFDKLSPELQKKYGYNPMEAAAFKAQQIEKNKFSQLDANLISPPHAEEDEKTEIGATDIERPERKQNPARLLNKDQLHDYIMGITNGWKGEIYFYKSERQKQALFRDVTGTKSDVFFAAVEDINQTFGYQKLLPQLSASNQLHDQSIVIFYGPKREGRKFLRDAGAEQRSNNEWSCWFWADEKKELKGIIAIYEEDVDARELPYYLRRSLLVALGYPGHTDVVESVFNDYRNRNQLKELPYSDYESKILSPYDRALLVFCDRFLVTDSSRGDIRIELRKNWWDFITKFDSKSNTKMDTDPEN